VLVYCSVGGMHSNLRGENQDNAQLLVTIGVAPDERDKRNGVFSDGRRVATNDRSTSHRVLAARIAAVPAIARSASGPRRRTCFLNCQRRRFHKMVDVLIALPNRIYGVKPGFQTIWMAAARASASAALIVSWRCCSAVPEIRGKPVGNLRLCRRTLAAVRRDGCDCADDEIMHHPTVHRPLARPH
jgi:hypothetical protein